MNPCSSGLLMTRTFSTDTLTTDSTAFDTLAFHCSSLIYFSSLCFLLLLVNLLFNNNKLLVITKIKTFYFKMHISFSMEEIFKFGSGSGCVESNSYFLLEHTPLLVYFILFAPTFAASVQTAISESTKPSRA